MKIIELNWISIEEFKEVDKLFLVVVLDDIWSLYNIGFVFCMVDVFWIECIYLCGIMVIFFYFEMYKIVLGVEFIVDWKYVNNVVEMVDNFWSEGYVVYFVE